MKRGQTALAVVMLAGAAWGQSAPVRFLGAIAGTVRAPGGSGQMGATVLLLNKHERLLGRVLTGPDGSFRFDSLSPDNYKIRVSQASYVPAARESVIVRAGLDSYLNVQMANLLSTIELVYQPPGQTGLIADEWKWTLRSSPATRPVLRYMPRLDPTLPGAVRTSSAFSATRGVVRLSGGGQGLSTALGNEPDLGTAFALATSLFGQNELRFSGNLAYATAAGAPAAGFRTRYVRTGVDLPVNPDVELTVRQVMLRQRAGTGLVSGLGSIGELPALRTMSVKVQDRTKLTDALSLDYGFHLDSVVFLDRLNYLSPFARLAYDLGGGGSLEFAYSSGMPATALLTPAGNYEQSIQQDLLGLAMFPRVSLRGGRARVQRSENFELGFRRTEGDFSYYGALYQERVGDLALSVAASPGLLPASELLPDISSNSSIFNAGQYRARGLMGGVGQAFWDNWSADLSYGYGTTLERTGDSFRDALSLRQALRPVNRHWAAARISGLTPGSATRFAATYVWTPANGLVPMHAFLTQRQQPQIGLNLQIRQPLPGFGGMPGRWEANAEIRNLISQGYVPLQSADGRRVVLVPFPKALRGGLSFIF